MKLVGCSIVLALLLQGIAWAEDYDFRRTRWGMAVEEVKAAEKTAKFISSSQPYPWHDLLIYDAELNGHQVELKYLFMDGKLARGGYGQLKTRFDDKYKYIELFNEMMAQLSDTYGRPAITSIYWTMNQGQDDIETQYFTGGWNRVPLDGQAKWSANGTFIELALSSNRDPDDLYFLLGFVEKKTYFEFSERLTQARGRP